MTNKEAFDWAETVLAVSGDYPGITAGNLATLRALSRKLQRLNEAQCNGEPVKEGAWDWAVDRVRDIAAAAGIPRDRVGIGTDPRGAPIKLSLPSGRSNCLDGTWRI